MPLVIKPSPVRSAQPVVVPRSRARMTGAPGNGALMGVGVRDAWAIMGSFPIDGRWGDMRGSWVELPQPVGDG